ncbi:MAG: SAM-dependent methyltransferase [Rickettsiales bacterium]|jgi:adenine-specific DNA-methyltransferase|nr:SAM-dependent methyltransferase [Rickettsiales bacterium]
MSPKAKIKSEGQVFTPAYLVKDMLDFIGYNGFPIINKHIMENSCGDGAFLCEIVRRYCKVYSRDSLKSELETYIHGIEKDPTEYRKCLENLDCVATEFGLSNVQWNIVCGDALELGKSYFGKMDFVVGNPPYVRVHNMDVGAKNFAFSSEGMTDLYLVFFEIGLNMLSPTGKMCLITPSSCLNSSAGASFRNYIFNRRNLRGIIDLEHFQPFPATTYTMISLFDNAVTDDRKDFSYYRYNGAGKINFVDNLTFNDAFINGKIYLAPRSMLQKLRDMETHYLNDKSIAVKNGFATLADDIFIGDFADNKNIIKIIKSSTGKWTKCIFPYKTDGSPLPEFAVRDNKYIWEHMSANREKLEKRAITNKNEWYLFGRSQALRDVSKNKIAVNQLIKDKNSLKVNFVPAGCGVYGGLYIISDKHIKEIQSALMSDEFLNYVYALKNYKSGGYYTFSSIDLAKFLNHYMNERITNGFELVANY